MIAEESTSYGIKHESMTVFYRSRLAQILPNCSVVLTEIFHNPLESNPTLKCFQIKFWGNIWREVIYKRASKKTLHAKYDKFERLIIMDEY